MERLMSFFSGAPQYPHKNRAMAYRSEKLEINETHSNNNEETGFLMHFFQHEKSLLTQWLSQSLQNQNVPASLPFVTPSPKQKIIFDTDIGTDVDDALALLMLLNFPLADVDLLGITTVYGPTKLRAKIAEHIIHEYQKTEEGKTRRIEVIAGEGVPVGTHRPVWITGTEGKGLFESDAIEKLVGEKGIGDEKPNDSAAKWMVSQVKKFPQQITIVANGMMSNIARACKVDPTFAANVKHLVYMAMGKRMDSAQTDLFPFTSPTEPYAAGKIYYFFPNHNISGDTWAAVQVFQQQFARVSVINDDVTNELWWAGESAKRLRFATSPAHHAAVGKLLNVWLRYRSGLFGRNIRGTCPHDAITTAEAVYPERFVEYVRGRLLIHEWAGFCSFVIDPTGPHRIGTRVKASHSSKAAEKTDRHKKTAKEYEEGTDHQFIRLLSSLLAPDTMQCHIPSLEEQLKSGITMMSG